MSQKLKAPAARQSGKPLTIDDVPIPELRPGHVPAKVRACGVGHTDLHAVNCDWPVKPKPPLIPGHKAVSHVTAIGSGVTHLNEGDPVGVPWLYTA